MEKVSIFYDPFCCLDTSWSWLCSTSTFGLSCFIFAILLVFSVCLCLSSFAAREVLRFSFFHRKNPLCPPLNATFAALCGAGISNYHGNSAGFSATSSSGGNGRFSVAASASTSLDGADLNGEILETPDLKVFSFSDLKSATRNFKSDNLLGEGGFGKVFKGWVDEKTLAPSKMGSGMIVAIKKLNPESVQGFDEWQVNSNSKSSSAICYWLH